MDISQHCIFEIVVVLRRYWYSCQNVCQQRNRNIFPPKVYKHAVILIVLSNFAVFSYMKYSFVDPMLCYVVVMLLQQQLIMKMIYATYFPKIYEDNQLQEHFAPSASFQGQSSNVDDVLTHLYILRAFFTNFGKCCFEHNISINTSVNLWMDKFVSLIKSNITFLTY